MRGASQAGPQLVERKRLRFIARKVVADHRAGKTGAAGFGQQAHVKSRKVAVAYKQLAAIGHQLEVDLGQDAADAIAAAQRHDHLHLRVACRRMQLRQSAGVGAAKALELVCGIIIIVNGGALRLEAGDAARQRRFIGRITAGGHDGDTNVRSNQAKSMR